MSSTRLQAEEIRRAVRRHRRQHRAVHGRPTGNDLHYRGYDILDVADTCEFEEIALPAGARQAAERGRTDGLQGEAEGAARPARQPSRPRSKRCRRRRIRWT